MESKREILERNLRTCKKICDSADIPYGNIISIKENRNFTRTWGRCERRKDGYIIEISDRLFKGNPEGLRQTILHEMIHTCPRAFNHGEVFKRYARRLDDYGYKVRRLTNAKELGLEDRDTKAKYKVVCERCGVESLYFKRSKIVQDLQRGDAKGYRCSRCRGEKFRLEVLK